MKGHSHLGQGIEYVTEHEFLLGRGDREEADDFLIVITDGKSSDEVSAPAKALRAENVSILAIGVTDKGAVEKHYGR